MKEQIERAIASVAARLSDRRLHVFRTQVESVENGIARLTGRVLEKENLDALRQELPPHVRLDDSAIQVLRRDPPETRTVITNLTDLHVEPSFLSEMLTQMFNGTSVEILEEKQQWCFVRQTDGYLGWAYSPYLASMKATQPTHLVSAPRALVNREPSDDSPPLTRLPGGTFVRAGKADDDFTFVELCSAMFPAGWIRTTHLRPLESFATKSDDARRQMIADARQLTGVYYLWGGCSAFGMDCSALAHLVHRLSGYTIPRDADLQLAAARPVRPPFQAGDLLFFAGPSSHGRKITHVGISTGGWKMIHSSRGKNGVYEEDVEANENLRKQFAGAGTFLDL